MNRYADVIDARIDLHSLPDGRNRRARKFGISDLDRRHRASTRLNFEFGGERSSVLIHSLLLNMKIFDVERVPRLDANRLPDSFGHVARAPVPAELIVSLPGVRRGGDVFFVSGVVRRNGRQLIWKGFHLRDH